MFIRFKLDFEMCLYRDLLEVCAQTICFQVKSKEGDLRRYSEVSQENDDLRHKIGELEALIARDSASEDENGSLQQEIAAMILEHQKIVQENRDLQQAVSEQRMLISESAESKAQAQNLREMLRKAESELSTIDAEVSRLRAEPPPNVLIELEELRQKVGDGLGNEKETLKRKLKEMESANDRSLIRLRQLDEISRSNAQLEKRLSDEKHRNEALEAQLLATSRDSLELQEIERLHDTIQQNEKQLKVSYYFIRTNYSLDNDGSLDLFTTNVLNLDSLRFQVAAGEL